MRSVFMAALVVGAVGAGAQGEVAYNNFGAGNGGFDYNWGLGWTVAGPDNGSGQFGVEQAQAFTAGATGELSDIWVPVWAVPFSAPEDRVTVHIASYAGDTPPTTGDILESWTINDFPGWSDWSMPHHLQSAGGVDIIAGERYWIWMEGGDTTWAGWAMNSEPSLTFDHTLRREGEDWLNISASTAGALRVDVVPAPGVLPIAAIAGLGLTRRRRVG